MLLRSILAVSVVLFAARLMAQDVVVIADDIAASHLLKRVDPVYPAFAKAAGIQGTVRVRLRVAPNGATEFVDCEMGPDFLQPAAQEAASQFEYQPFQQDGKAVQAEFLTDVPFRLPMGTHVHAYRPPPLSGTEFFAQRALTPFEALSPSLRNWLAAAQKPHLDTHAIASGSQPAAAAQTGATAVNIPVGLPGVKLYLITTRNPGECGNHEQCHVRLVEDRSGVIVPVADASANGFTFHTRSGSPYPDVFLSDYGGASHLIVHGYSNIDGEWGKLYCGDIVTSSGEDMENDVHQCR